jgi:hypothetical protein
MNKDIGIGSVVLEVAAFQMCGKKATKIDISKSLQKRYNVGEKEALSIIYVAEVCGVIVVSEEGYISLFEEKVKKNNENQ